MRRAAIDGPDGEALVQFGAGLPRAAIADEAERRLGTPVVAAKVATFRRALREGAVPDEAQGRTRLMRGF